MKGEIAEPWVNTTNPANSPKMTQIGSSQNLLRTCRNRQNSSRKLSMRRWLTVARFGGVRLHETASLRQLYDSTDASQAAIRPGDFLKLTFLDMVRADG